MKHLEIIPYTISDIIKPITGFVLWTVNCTINISIMLIDVDDGIGYKIVVTLCKNKNKKTVYFLKWSIKNYMLS